MDEVELGEVVNNLPENPEEEFEATLLVLAQTGEALRSDLPIPARLRDWVKSLSWGLLNEVVRSENERMERTLLPVEDNPLFDIAVGVREDADNLAASIRYACVYRNEAPETYLPEWNRLRENCRIFDENLSKVLRALLLAGP